MLIVDASCFLVEVDVCMLHNCFGLCGLDVASIEYGLLVW